MNLSPAEWRKSTRSQGASSNCVEVARNLPGLVAVRDSKNPNGGKLTFSPAAWRSFINSLKTGGYDL